VETREQNPAVAATGARAQVNPGLATGGVEGA